MKKFIILFSIVIMFSSCSKKSVNLENMEIENKNDDIIIENQEYTEKVEYPLSSTNTNTGDNTLKQYNKNPTTYEDRMKNIDNTEKYQTIIENTKKNVLEDPLMTFSLKVDTASYRNVIRFLKQGILPPTDAVRIEELINYFNYEKKLPENNTPFSVYSEIGQSPFNKDKYLAFVRVKTKDIDKKNLSSNNITFLIDTSGSMSSYDKLPLLKNCLNLMVENLNENDIISIVTYAGTSSIVLDGVSGFEKEKIKNAIDSLATGGSTAGANGILTAYLLAEKNFKKNENNRIILATDGDFNVGLSSTKELGELISVKKESGIYLSILGFGTGNLNDELMESLSKNGNGNYGYIDSIETANKLLINDITSNLYTIADDVKAQIEFNANKVLNYRLIGYENRKLKNNDFNDDSVDAGEIGIGTDVIILLEIELNKNDATDLKYKTNLSDELFEIRLRYKNPGEFASNISKYPVTLSNIKNINTDDFNFAKSVAVFGSVLKNSDYINDATLFDTMNIVSGIVAKQPSNEKLEYIEMINILYNILKE